MVAGYPHIQVCSMEFAQRQMFGLTHFNGSIPETRTKIGALARQ